MPLFLKLTAPPHILLFSVVLFSSCPSSSFPSSRGGRRGQKRWGIRARAAKNCMDTRGGRGRQREGGGRAFSLCCCNAAQSVCQRRARHETRASAHAQGSGTSGRAGVFLELCVCGTGDFIPSERGGIRPHPPQIHHSPAPPRTCARVR